MSTEFSKRLRTAFPMAKIGEKGGFGPVLALASGQELPDVCARLRNDSELGLDVLEDYTALDEGGQFVLVLHLLRLSDPSVRLTVKAFVPRDAAEAPTLTALYGSADWYEREIFDMFGVRFTGHPDLRRILLPEDWTGYPLRKDYTDDKILKRPVA